MRTKSIGGRQYITPPQFAEREGVCLGTIYTWDKHNICPKSWKRGRMRGWWLDQIEAWESAGFPVINELPAEEQLA